MIKDDNHSPMVSNHPLSSNVDRVLISNREIMVRISELAQEISKDYAGEDIVVIGVLKGAMPFMAYLIKEITTPIIMDFVAISSYSGGTSSTGIVRFQKDVEESLKDKHVLIIEDIVDTGLTLKYLLETFKLRQPKSMAICCLVDKPARRKVEIPVKYAGFTIPNCFIFGFGINCEEIYRNLDFVGIMDPQTVQRIQEEASGVLINP